MGKNAKPDRMIELLEKYPALFPFAFLAMWVFIVSVLSKMSGWRNLAAHHTQHNDFEGPKRRYQSLSMKTITFFPVNFSSVVTLGANGSGILLSLLIPFRMFHPSLFINYTNFNGTERRMFFFEQVEIQVVNAPGVKISISKSQADWIENQSGGTWSYQRL